MGGRAQGGSGVPGEWGELGGAGHTGIGEISGGLGRSGEHGGSRGWQWCLCPILEHLAPSFGKGCPPFAARPSALGCVPLTRLSQK